MSETPTVRLTAGSIKDKVGAGTSRPPHDVQLPVIGLGTAGLLGESGYELVAATGVVPAVNQVPWSPRRHDPETLAASRERDVVVMGYGPLRRTDLADPTLATVAEVHGVSPAQVVLRWHLHHDVLVIPRSADPDRRRANLDALTFELTPEEIAAIDALTQ